MSDPRIVNGARCAWWGSISEVGVRTPAGFLSPPITPERLGPHKAGLPCCPHCGGMLFETASIEAWWQGVDAYDARHPGYRKLIEWLRGKHFDTLVTAGEAFRTEEVDRWLAEPLPPADELTRERERRGLMPRRLEKKVRFCDQPMRIACDGRCDKAWGSNSRPKIQISANPDDYAWLSDDELGAAPADPGTSEGGHLKPIGVRSASDMNKWCVRECERLVCTRLGQHDGPLELRDLSVRFYNIAPHRRDTQ